MSVKQLRGVSLSITHGTQQKVNCKKEFGITRISYLEEAASHENVNIATELENQTPVEVCKTASLKSQKQKNSFTLSTNWFDEECETEKENQKTIGKRITHNPDNVQLRTLLHEKEKSFKKTCKRKKCFYLSKEIADVDQRNSKDTWKQIGTIFSLRKRKPERVQWKQ